MQFPARIHTRRLVLRTWRAGDGARLKDAIDANLTHLQQWMPWAMNEPSPLDEVEERVARFEAAFAAGDEWIYGIFHPDGETVIGSTGLHPRAAADSLEIGYWIDARLVRHGYATEAAQALTDLALGQPDIDYIEIRCDPRHTASAAVPRKLGYMHVDTLCANTETPSGEPRDTMVWRLTRSPRHPAPVFSFRRVSAADLPLLHEWLNRPHIYRWWPGRPSLAEVEQDFGPLLASSSSVKPYLALLDGVPAGYIQSYVVLGSGGGWWPNETDPGARGIDQYLAEPGAVGRGLGTEMVRQFVATLFADPSVTRVQTDPEPVNPRAVRCYEKAGFRRLGEVRTPDGPALLMTIQRPPR
jgi:RimJ/RimL family protein N-acetyltransferase